MSKGVVLSVDSAKILKDMIRGREDEDFGEDTGQAVGSGVSGNRFSIIKAIATTGYTSVSGPIIWTGEVAAFDGSQGYTSLGSVYLADFGNSLVANHYYVAAECGAIPNPVPSGSGLTSGTPVFLVDSSSVSGIDASCSNPRGLITNAAQTLCGRKQFNDGITNFGTAYFTLGGLAGIPFVTGFKDVTSTNPRLRMNSNLGITANIAFDLDPVYGYGLLSSPDGGVGVAFAINTGTDVSPTYKTGITGTLSDGSTVTGGLITTAGSGAGFLTGTFP